MPSSPAKPQRPTYSHNQQAHDKMLNITDHQGTQINSTARQPQAPRTNTVKTQKPVLARTQGTWDAGHHCRGSQYRGCSRSRRRATV